MGGCSDPKVTIMVLKANLHCCKCYMKVKRLLCQYPQIRNQEYDEKTNTVTITVVCCSPEKIRDKLCRKGGKCIKSIEIKEPKPESKPKPKPEPEPKPEHNPPPPPPQWVCCKPCYHGVLVAQWVCCEPCSPGVPGCCGPCSRGEPGGPCHEGYGPRYTYSYGRPPCPPAYYVSCCDYLSEENPSACSIM